MPPERFTREARAAVGATPCQIGDLLRAARRDGLIALHDGAIVKLRPFPGERKPNPSPEAMTLKQAQGMLKGSLGLLAFWEGVYVRRHGHGRRENPSADQMSDKQIDAMARLHVLQRFFE